MKIRRLLLILVIVALALTVATSAMAAYTHVVQPGETLYSIARDYGVSVNALLNANYLPNPNYIYVGQVLTIPSVGGPAVGVHYVGYGETFSSIARAYGTSVSYLASLNPGIGNINYLWVGQPIYVPLGYGGPGYHVVSYGETLASIGRMYGVSWWYLADVNGLSWPYTIYPGMRIWIAYPGA